MEPERVRDIQSKTIAALLLMAAGKYGQQSHPLMGYAGFVLGFAYLAWNLFELARFQIRLAIDPAYRNAAMDWGGTRWTTISWPFLAAMQEGRGQLMIHELFHRIQPQLGLLIPDMPNDHLDTPDGRYWMQLEWKALRRALGSSGETSIVSHCPAPN